MTTVAAVKARVTGGIDATSCRGVDERIAILRRMPLRQDCYTELDLYNTPYDDQKRTEKLEIVVNRRLASRQSRTDCQRL